MSSGAEFTEDGHLYIEPDASDLSPLLDNVLDLTEYVGDGDVDQMCRRLAAVAQGLAEPALTPVGLTRIVTECLRDYASEARLSEETWKRVSIKVADVLFEDPSARARLARLWLQLMEIRL